MKDEIFKKLIEETGAVLRSGKPTRTTYSKGCEKMSDQRFRVVVRRHSDNEVEHVVGTDLSRPRARKVEDGLLINLDHERFYTMVEEEKSEKVVGR